jgi:hypothetical protein
MDLRTAKAPRAKYMKLLQRELEQGHVPSIKSAVWNGQRVVFVGRKLYGPDKWKTFIDFLDSYMKLKFTTEWGNAEIAKPAAERHPVIVWYQDVCEFQRKHAGTRNADGIYSADMTGSVYAYFSLAYDLYVLEHLSLMEPVMLKRLRHADQFHGARYEAFVAATFLRSGFTVELENERDELHTHCEFTARDRNTQRAFSVEAKTRARDGTMGRPGEFQDPGGDAKINRPLRDALSKEAKHERIIFIDANMPPDEAPLVEKDWFKAAFTSMKLLEAREDPEQPYPPAFVFLTNRPHHYVRNTADAPGSMYCFTAIKRPEFKRDETRPTVDLWRSVEAAHPEFRELLKTLEFRNSIPNEFE